MLDLCLGGELKQQNFWPRLKTHLFELGPTTITQGETNSITLKYVFLMFWH